MQNPALVGGDLDVADESRVAPDAERVVGEAARADDLTVARAPPQAGDLRASVDAVHAGTRGGVPEVDVTVVRTTARGEQVHVPRAPGKGLDCRLVVRLGELGHGQRARVPDGDEVVVAAGGELGTVRAPLQTADLGSVRDELGYLVLRNTDIVVEDEPAPSSGRQQVLVPAHHADTGVMAEHAANLNTFRDIPDLDLTGSKTDTDVGSITRPLNAADIGIRGGLHEAVDAALVGRPDVDVALKANSDLVAGAPVKKVEVVVINEARGIEHPLRSSSNTASELSRTGVRRLEGPVVLLAKINRLRRLRGCRLELENPGVEVHPTRIGQGVLVRHGVGRWTSVSGLVFLLVDVEVVKGSDGIIRGRVQDSGSLAIAGLGPRLVLNVKLAGARIRNSGAVAAVGNEAIGCVSYSCLGLLLQRGLL